MNERGVIYWNLEIDPEEVNRRMECALCDREAASSLVYLDPGAIACPAGELQVLMVGSGAGKSRMNEMFAALIAPSIVEDQQTEDAIIDPPKNKPYYRQFDKHNKW